MARKMIARNDAHPSKYGRDHYQSNVHPGQTVYIADDAEPDSDGDVYAHVSPQGADGHYDAIGYVRFADLTPANEGMRMASAESLTQAARLLGYDIDTERLFRVANRLATVDLS